MKDVFGTELEIGDTVITFGKLDGMELIKLKVVGFTAKKIKLEGRCRANWVGTWLPKQVMKIENKGKNV